MAVSSLAKFPTTTKIQDTAKEPEAAVWNLNVTLGNLRCFLLCKKSARHFRLLEANFEYKKIE